ncbi:peptidase U32 family protein [Candidatus Moduliflexus flocculans]|uniref:Peptidase U32 family protein n=1 Tax=Candidatus Moduliflexus flocculans TaxID=1499966 RepID=A0A081BSJ5_9BACT|nr:peptidase U32 family protein [Candidatus Moduliflexus flocculans]
MVVDAVLQNLIAYGETRLNNYQKNTFLHSNLDKKRIAYILVLNSQYLNFMDTTSPKIIELLAPAKNADAGIAAITCGADAVYIGAARFGAREQAGNSVADIERLAQFAHRYWARVYVALNTLLYDDEFPEALRLIGELYDAGTDGLIIQDMGLLECDLPPLPLIASTQTHNAAPEKVAFLERVGFQRAILARELNLEQIRAIRAQTSLELECFVHGALCVCYSGQCYLSYAIGGRSGNRGQCAQPCRKRYTLKDTNGQILAQNRYLLSLKDMNRAAALRDLLEAGVTSFKIEGRLKDIAYVKNIVSYYRQQLDVIFDAEPERFRRASSGRSSIDFTPNPAKTFHRGSTPYFLYSERDNVASLDTPKSIGEEIGVVAEIGAKYFTLSPTNSPHGSKAVKFSPHGVIARSDNDEAISSNPGLLRRWRSLAMTRFHENVTALPGGEFTLHNGDGLCFFDANRELQGTLVNAVQGERVFPASMRGISVGTVMYRNADHRFLKLVESSRIERLISIAMIFRETADGFALTAIDEDGVQVEEVLTGEKIAANNLETAAANIIKQLNKCGGTEFGCVDIDIEWTMPYFLPAAQLNTLRRAALDKLREAREASRPIQRGTIEKNDALYPETRLSYHGNVLNVNAAAFYRRHGVIEIEPAAESGLDMRGRNVMTTKYCIRQALGFCERDGRPAQKYVEPLYLVDEQGQAYQLQFHCSRCEMEIFYPDSSKC